MFGDPGVRRTDGIPGGAATLWDIATGYWPNYDVYQARTSRVIPIVVLQRRERR
ncbi:nitroreductase/quinone reductase family protein [Nocardia coffeae]|uniref:nitroreductase/quinone reductase family protein n=1 Tax=Nocardia coffeae TaxID=2873381 RepID=UPI0035562146